MISRFEYMIKNGRDGIRLGIIQVDLAIKYEAYITYLEFMEELKDTPLEGKRTSKRRRALQMTAEKLNISEHTVWKHMSFFDYIAPTTDELAMYKNTTRWTFVK